jgi:hypothetical protein
VETTFATKNMLDLSFARILARPATAERKARWRGGRANPEGPWPLPAISRITHHKAQAASSLKFQISNLKRHAMGVGKTAMKTPWRQAERKN